MYGKILEAVAKYCDLALLRRPRYHPWAPPASSGQPHRPQHSAQIPPEADPSSSTEPGTGVWAITPVLRLRNVAVTP